MWDHFNFLAPIYDKVIQPKPPQKLIELLDFGSGQSLLDVGGGTGRIAQFLTGPSRQIFLADTSQQMLLQSQEKSGLRQINTASEFLPFPNDYFDRVLMVDVLHHVSDQSLSVMEMWRVLKPGGKIVIEEPDIRKFAVKLVALAEKLALMRSHFLGAEAICQLFIGLPGDLGVFREEHYLWVVGTKT
jgi:ubiquinone/menaquinone biosynthesis C-methylase UbiE